MAGIKSFDLFGSCDIDRDRMTFMYELNPCLLETYRMCENEHVNVVKAFESYRMKGGECVHLVTRGHFRSRDKDGGHTIRSAALENLMLHANLTALSVIEPELGDQSFTLREYEF